MKKELKGTEITEVMCCGGKGENKGRKGQRGKGWEVGRQIRGGTGKEVKLTLKITKKNPYENLLFDSCVFVLTQKNLTGDTLQRAWCSHKSHRLPNKKLSARYERSPFKLWPQISSCFRFALLTTWAQSGHRVQQASGCPKDSGKHNSAPVYSV